MLLPNKAKSITAVILLSLGALGSQIFLTTKAQAPVRDSEPSRCNIESQQLCNLPIIGGPGDKLIF